MDIRSLETHQERKDARKARRALIAKAFREQAHQPKSPNRKKNKELRRARPSTEGQRGMYISQRQPPYMRKPERERVKMMAKIMQVRFELMRKDPKFADTDTFMAYCEEKLTEEEYTWVRTLFGLSDQCPSDQNQETESGSEDVEVIPVNSELPENI
jgi:hypothetical protein